MENEEKSVGTSWCFFFPSIDKVMMVQHDKVNNVRCLSSFVCRTPLVIKLLYSLSSLVLEMKFWLATLRTFV